MDSEVLQKAPGQGRAIDFREMDSEGLKINCDRWQSAVFSFVLTFVFPVVAVARLGESESDCNTRYGGPLTDKVTLMQEKALPLVEGLRCRTYNYEGWRIRAAFADFPGPAVRMEYRKSGKDGVLQLKDYEVEAILKAECNAGQTWSAVAYNNPKSPNSGLAKLIENLGSNAMGAGAWQRPDGAIAVLDVGKMVLVIDSPEVRAYELRLKRDKEERQRSSVPKF